MSGKTFFAGEGLEIFIGQGPARLQNGEMNPVAVGVLLTDASVGLIRIGSAAPYTYALVATGTVSVIGVDGVTAQGTAQRARERFRRSPWTKRCRFRTPPAKSILRVQHYGRGGQKLRGAQLPTHGLRSNAGGRLLLRQIDGRRTARPQSRSRRATFILAFGDGTTDFVSLTGGSGALVIGGGGIAGEVSGTVNVNVPGLEFIRFFTLNLNSLGGSGVG